MLLNLKQKITGMLQLVSILCGGFIMMATSPYYIDVESALYFNECSGDEDEQSFFCGTPFFDNEVSMILDLDEDQYNYLRNAAADFSYSSIDLDTDIDSDLTIEITSDSTWGEVFLDIQEQYYGYYESTLINLDEILYLSVDLISLCNIESCDSNYWTSEGSTTYIGYEIPRPVVFDAPIENVIMGSNGTGYLLVDDELYFIDASGEYSRDLELVDLDDVEAIFPGDDAIIAQVDGSSLNSDDYYVLGLDDPEDINEVDLEFEANFTTLLLDNNIVFAISVDGDLMGQNLATNATATDASYNLTDGSLHYAAGYGFVLDPSTASAVGLVEVLSYDSTVLDDLNENAEFSRELPVLPNNAADWYIGGSSLEPVLYVLVEADADLYSVLSLEIFSDDDEYTTVATDVRFWAPGNEVPTIFTETDIEQNPSVSALSFSDYLIWNEADYGYIYNMTTQPRSHDLDYEYYYYY